MAEIHVSLKAEEIFHIGDLAVSNAMIGSTVVLALIIGFGLFVRATLSKTGVPSKPQLFVEAFYELLENIAHQNLDKHYARKYLGLILTLFLYIVLGSWFGLLPGVLSIGIEEAKGFTPLFRAPTSDLNGTIALAVVAFLSIQLAGFSSLGFWSYLGKFFNFKHGIIQFLLGFLELISEFVRLISFSVRLFGNIFAGELLLVVITALTKFNDTSNTNSVLNFIGVPFPALVILMEFFVALVQAYVFINLMAIFVTLAATPHENDDHGGLEFAHGEHET